MAASLVEIEALVDQLELADQARLVQRLVPRLTEALTTRQTTSEDAARAWQEYRRVGERLAASDAVGGSMTQEISDMRR